MNHAQFEKEKNLTYNKVPVHELINFNKTPENPVKVSVVVPVCNVETYLRQCLDSAINQTMKDIEIICVNDGSTDNSLDILKEYAQKDSRIKVIDKDNAGYGHVMNIGMDMASGEYLAILESDDYILPEMFERLYEVAVKHDLDFVKSDFYRFYGEDDSLITEYNKIAREDANYNVIINPSENQDVFKFIMNTWCGIYKTSFIRENLIRHNETPGASFQDNGFWFKANVFGKRTMYLPETFYMNRRDNPNSSVHNREKVYCGNTEYDLIYDFLVSENIKDEFLEVYNYKKYHTYLNFTLKRIAPEYKKEFINTISNEFKEFNKKDELKFKFLSPIELNNVKWIMRDPDEFYYEFEKKNIAVSVILPVYNVENYLEKCLDTLTKQTLKNIEILCINDGSTDNSLEILEKYQAIDHRIKIFNQDNEGAGTARNLGISLAQGEYLSFLDSDDFFDKDMLRLAYNQARNYNADICIYESFLYDNISKRKEKCTYSIKYNQLPKKHVFNRRDVNTNIFKDIMGWPWDKLYKTSFVLNNNLKFQEQRTTNDMYFVYASLLKAGRISLLKKPLYYHRKNDNTSLSNTREKSWDCFYHALMKVKQELKDMNLYEEYNQFFINYALHSCLWNINTLDEATGEKLFYKLREEWFDSLDINGHDADYFENRLEYNQYLEIISSPEDISEDYSSYMLYHWKNKYSTTQADDI
ncbi:glycosyltransferase family 2 protein, partial [Methanosphaera sp.]